MKRVIYWLQIVFSRAILTLSWVGIALLLSTNLVYDNSLQTQTEQLIPEPTKYQVKSKDSPFRENEQEKVNALFKENKNPQTASGTTKEIGENLTKPQKAIKKTLEDATDKVREKLNLD